MAVFQTLAHKQNDFNQKKKHRQRQGNQFQETKNLMNRPARKETDTESHCIQANDVEIQQGGVSGPKRLAVTRKKMATAAIKQRAVTGKGGLKPD